MCWLRHLYISADFDMLQTLLAQFLNLCSLTAYLYTVLYFCAPLIRVEHKKYKSVWFYDVPTVLS